MATFRRGKPVWVAVYVEGPRKKSLLPSHNRQNHHHHHHHHHLHLHQVKNGCRSPGYDRKAHLLEYSRKLRESARSQTSSPVTQPVSSHHHHRRQHPMTQLLPARKKRKESAIPACLGNWKLLLPGFIRALLNPHQKKDKRKKHANPGATTTKIKSLVKTFQVKKKGGFTSKMFASRRRHW